MPGGANDVCSDTILLARNFFGEEFTVRSFAKLLHDSAGIESGALTLEDYQLGLADSPDAPWQSLSSACASILAIVFSQDEVDPADAFSTLGAILVLGNASSHGDEHWEFCFFHALGALVKCRHLLEFTLCYKALEISLRRH
jgi:hypothetical protein